MATTFVAQADGTGEDLWWGPWVVIRLAEDNVEQDDLDEATRQVKIEALFDDLQELDLAAVEAEFTRVMTAAGYTLLAVEPARLLHLGG